MEELSPIAQSLQTIRSWFEMHSPEELTAFRGPCAEDDLVAIEQATGRPLPADQRAWWRLTDGTNDLLAPSLIPLTWAPLPTGTALHRYRMMCSISQGESQLPERMSEPAGTPCSGMWLPHWFPVAHNLGGDFLFLDLRPGPRYGCLGEHRKDEWRYDGPVWSSVTEMLSVVARALAEGTEIRYRHAAIEDGRLGWLLDPKYREVLKRNGSINS